MIVDNDDNPFIRTGGIYLYTLNYTTNDPLKILNLLDFINYEDL